MNKDNENELMYNYKSISDNVNKKRVNLVIDRYKNAVDNFNDYYNNGKLKFNLIENSEYPLYEYINNSIVQDILSSKYNIPKDYIKVSIIDNKDMDGTIIGYKCVVTINIG
jgi:hypothetical protein